MSTPASSARAAPSPTIPSPNSVPASSTNGSSLNTPTSSSTCMSSFDSDLDSKINDLRRSWTAGGACAGPDLMYNCAEYATFLPRPNTSKERSSYEKFPESISTNGKANQYDWIAPRSPPAVSGWAAGTQYGFVKGYPRAALREFYDRYPSGSNVEAPRQGPKAEDYQVTLMIQGLPPLMSPTIPAWPSSVTTQRAGASATVAARTPRPTPTPTPTPIPPRSHIGGKQPGKLPMSTLHGNHSFSSDDDSSDSGSDSDASGNDSDDHPMSDIEADPRDRKSIGRKTAEFTGIADRDSGAGQSPLSHARKSYSDNGVSLLNSEQVDALPSRRRGMVLSKTPVVVKITIPRTHRQALKSIGHSQADGSASSNLAKHRLPDSSDSEDRKKPKPKSKGKNLVSESTAIPWKRLPGDSDDDSDERKKSKPKAKARRPSADTDSDRDTKPAASETSKGQTKSTEVRKVAPRRGSVDRPHSRPNESKSLSPVLDRNRDRDRDRNGDRDKWKSYHSADEGEIEETSRSQQSFRDKEKNKDKEAKIKTESKDRSEQVSSKESHKSESASRKDRYARIEPVESKAESGHARERSDSVIPKDTRDRADPSQSRKDRDIKEESKEKSSRTEKPPSTANKDRKEDDSGRTAGISKTDRSNTHGTTTAAPSSPSRRSSRDDAKDSGKSRGDKDSRDDRTTTSNKDARSSTSTSTGTTKDRARGRSRTRSRSRSPRSYYDRKRSPSSRDARDSKSTRDRREYDDDRSSSRRKKEGRQRDHSRDRNDRSSRGRSRDRSRDRFGRDRSRDRSADRGNSRDRKRARSRSRERRTNRDTHSPPPSTRQDSHRSDIKQDSRPGLGRRESESHHGSSVSSTSAARRPSQAVSASIKEEPTSTSATAVASSSSTSEAPSSTSGNAASTSASAIKRVSIEDYQRKRGIVENKVETPKAAIDSPALASTTTVTGKVSQTSNDSKDQPSSSSSSQREQKSSSSQPKLSNEVFKKAADYYNTFRLLRAEGTTHKHNADKTLKTQNNPRLGAVQYFLGAIDFIAAFQANDKYLALSNPGQPDVAMKESVHSWETMRQFIFALTNQCHQNHLAGLDGLSALVEVLVYFKVYSCHATLLRKEMLRSGQFKTKVSKEDIANGATVAVSADLASRMMQNMEDWSHIQKRTEDVRQWLTPDIARAQFPETFARWLVHPDQVAAGTAGGYVSGTTNTAKIQWPLGTHLSLHTLMEMVVEAVKEFCQRHSLNGKPSG
ncbi:hypothetical protein BG003_001036 [Podila horticola]|nr:hypothetical protein BG003_001036 [Podila horticola]